MISLQNKNILVTREERGAKRFAEKIAIYHGKPIVVPLLEINCLPVREDIGDIRTFDWIFFTSQNGVDCFLKNARFARELHDVRIAAVGPKTAQVIEREGYTVDFIPSTYNAEVMAKEFLSTYVKTGPILLVRGVLSRPVLADALTKAGRTIVSLNVYDTVTNSMVKGTLTSVLSKQTIDLLTFTSPSTVDAFTELVEHPNQYHHLPAACIGTTTEKRAKEIGFTQTIVPRKFTIEGMLKAMSDYLK
ncbi:MAG TPA: uroporphyrinogen-III synthase [Virgibacillus sp.]|nr:uroporphyrinogen-III synthase [Virgibacillus sp.]HLR68544.1 uroporphyrinogen-III synthase [Virgibacillus sp.]